MGPDFWKFCISVGFLSLLVLTWGVTDYRKSIERTDIFLEGQRTEQRRDSIEGRIRYDSAHAVNVERTAKDKAERIRKYGKGGGG